LPVDKKEYYHKQRLAVEEKAKKRVPGAEMVRRKIDQKRFGSGRGDQAIDNSMETIGQLPSFATGGAEAKAAGMAFKGIARGVQAFRAGRAAKAAAQAAQKANKVRKATTVARTTSRVGKNAVNTSGDAANARMAGKVAKTTIKKGPMRGAAKNSFNKSVETTKKEVRDGYSYSARGSVESGRTKRGVMTFRNQQTAEAARAAAKQSRASAKARKMLKDDKGGARADFAKGAAAVGAAGGTLYGAKKAKEKLDDLASKIPG
jgi:hypothetical protein